MNKFVLLATASITFGIIIGWNLRYFAADGPDGIQWQFNDAARRGDVNEMKKLIYAGADPLAFPSYADGAITGATPLFEAASVGEPRSIEFLIEQGADVNLIQATESPLDAARIRLMLTTETIDILEKHGALTLSEVGELLKIQTEQGAAANP